MKVLMIGKVPREGGMVDVTLSKDGTRFTVSVSAILAESDGAQAVYERMADHVVASADTLRSIVAQIRVT